VKHPLRELVLSQIRRDARFVGSPNAETLVESLISTLAREAAAGIERGDFSLLEKSDRLRQTVLHKLFPFHVRWNPIARRLSKQLAHVVLTAVLAYLRLRFRVVCGLTATSVALCLRSISEEV
jgi:hypothetical protein